MFFRSRNRLTPLALGLLIALGQAAPAALAEPTAAQRHYRIEPGALDAALTRFAGLAGVTLTYDPALARGKRTGGLDGSYGVEAGFAALLAGTGLEWVLRADGSYSLRPLPQDAALLKAVKVQASGLDTLTEESGGYTAQAVAAGSKVEQSLRDTPRSVSVIARQQLDDQRITSLDEVMEQMPGVTMVPGSTGYMASSYYSRGFQITSVMVDGSPAATWNSNDTSGNIGMSKYDNVQLMRGPDGIFSGNGQPSGSINLVRKRALDSFQLKYAVSAGSWDNYFGELDVTDKLVESGRVRGRFVAAYNSREFFFAGADREVSTLFGTLSVDLSEATMLTIGINQDKDRGAGRDIAPGFPRYADGSPVPVPRKQGYADWSQKNTEALGYFATIDHAFSDAWKARANLVRTESDSLTNVSSYNGATDPLTGLGSYLFQGTWAESDFDTTSIDAYVSGDFSWLDRQHRLVVGGDYRKSENATQLYYSTAGRADITDWRHTDPDALLPDNSRGAIDWLMAGETDQYGAYVYGDFQIAGPLNLVLGGRYSGFEAMDRSGDTSGGQNPPLLTTNDSDGEFTPYYALKYMLSAHWTAYFAVAESFEDQSRYYTENDEPLDPTRGRSYELGIKGEHWDGRLNSNFTVYRTRRDNFAVRVSQPADFDLPGRACCYVGDGEFLSQGIELEISGQLLPGWQINGGYTYDDNETEYGASDGLRYASYTPKQILRIWSRYDLPGSLSRWSIGGGVKAQSSFFRSGTVRSWNPTGGSDGNGAFDGPAVPFDFTEPGRTIWNAFVEYRLPADMTLALNVNNLFDKHYFRSVNNTSTGNIHGDPRNWMLTLRGRY